MAEKTVDVPTGRETSGREGTRSVERYVAPPVNIYEVADGLVLVADLPGTSKEKLNVGVKEGVLTIQANAAHASPGEPVYREYELSSFFRQFEISEELDQERIQAELKHGVLTLRLPKAEKAKPRQIEVKVS